MLLLLVLRASACSAANTLLPLLLLRWCLVLVCFCYGVKGAGGGELIAVLVTTVDQPKLITAAMASTACLAARHDEAYTGVHSSVILVLRWPQP
jgi:Flp pilus assembly protein protease CpaA